MNYPQQDRCVHEFIVYRGVPGGSGVKNWCHLCGKIRQKEDAVRDDIIVTGIALQFNVVDSQGDMFLPGSVDIK